MDTKEKKPVISNKLLWGIIIFSCIIAIVYLIMVMLHREYDTHLPVDDSLFGTYGDFIGGVIGTIVAFYSAYLLVRTFENQADTNDSVVEANKAAISASQIEGYLSQMERFDNMFNSFLSSYFKVIDSYNYENRGIVLSGRNAFEKIVDTFIEKDFSNNFEYQRRSYAAVQEYADFYAQERTHLSVHLRLLYLTMSFIANSELEEEDKVKYAKLIRGQMSDAEMIIVRYNCCSDYDVKMREYCNMFNLTKHAPIMHLLEFRSYYKLIKKKVEDNQSENFTELIGGLEAMFITLRKKASQILYAEGTASDSFSTNKRYSIEMTTNGGHRQFEFLFFKDKQVNRVGGGYRLKSAEKALDLLDDENLLNLFFDFSCELFKVSNFEEYNQSLHLNKKVMENNENSYSFSIKISSTKALALTTIQANRRDNPVIEEI